LTRRAGQSGRTERAGAEEAKAPPPSPPARAPQPLASSPTLILLSPPENNNQNSPLAPAAAAAAAAPTSTGLTPCHGGLPAPVDLLLRDPASVAAAKQKCTRTVALTDRQACDLELLCVGGFTPLTGFMDKRDYESVVERMRLADDSATGHGGLLFGLPIVLDTDSEEVAIGDELLFTYQGVEVGSMTVTDKYKPSKARECLGCYGTSSIEHPAVQMVAMERGKYYLSGPVRGFALPEREFSCATPSEVRATLPTDGRDVLAFQCRNPIHRAHYELFIRALDAPNVGKDAVCLVHPTCGPTQDDDIPGDVRYRTYVVLEKEVANPRLRWAYLPYSMHMAGPREAIQHMIMRKNYGCTHFIIGRDMAGCKSSVTGEDFYAPYDAQDTAAANAAELGMKTVPSLNIAYTQEAGYVTADVAKEKGYSTLSLSGTKFRKMLRAGEQIPEWFAFPSVVEVLREAAMAASTTTGSESE
jgi:sulfate adenylyltransferase